jgi:hypothetical protein
LRVPEETKNQRKILRPIQIRLATPSLEKSRLLVKNNPATSANRCFQFQKRSQLFIRTHDETLSVVVIRAGNVIETHEHKGDFKEWVKYLLAPHRTSR